MQAVISLGSDLERTGAGLERSQLILILAHRGVESHPAKFEPQQRKEVVDLFHAPRYAAWA